MCLLVSLVLVLLFEITWAKQTDTSHISPHDYQLHCVLSNYFAFTYVIACSSHLPFWFISSGQSSKKTDARMVMGKAGGENKWRKRREVGRLRIASRVTGFLMCKLIRGKVEKVEINGWDYCIHPLGHIILVKILSKLSTTAISLNTMKQDDS